jgi:hypothetical protein
MLSSDVQSEQKAVVTVQETWMDQIFNGEYPEDGAEVVSERGPYTLTAQYILTYTPENSWQPWTVEQVTYSEQPPEWTNK